jgi:hypothetical protein
MLSDASSLYDELFGRLFDLVFCGVEGEGGDGGSEIKTATATRLHTFSRSPQCESLSVAVIAISEAGWGTAPRTALI